MPRFELTDRDRYLIAKVREALTRVDLSDERVMARSLGRLEVSVEQWLKVFYEDGES